MLIHCNTATGRGPIGPNSEFFAGGGGGGILQGGAGVRVQVRGNFHIGYWQATQKPLRGVLNPPDPPLLLVSGIVSKQMTAIPNSSSIFREGIPRVGNSLASFSSLQLKRVTSESFGTGGLLMAKIIAMKKYFFSTCLAILASNIVGEIARPRGVPISSKYVTYPTLLRNCRFYHNLTGVTTPRSRTSPTGMEVAVIFAGKLEMLLLFLVCTRR